ncbi:NUDIX domain-containing protein [Amycolatopsis sp. cmx-4-68]|uniref:NUDIX domain-containing protein n=1 Tax=Amycolatopsis sp. cmx-4-68 TaxID=2790938 RepID=UPI00397E206F
MRTYAGVVVVGADGRVALQIRDDVPWIANPGMITTFGGLAEGDETPRAAAVRELGEELGIVPDAADLIELARQDKRETDGDLTHCVLYQLSVSTVAGLRTHEGAGVLVGPHREVLLDTRLTPTCRVAVEAFAERLERGR